ncbi:MAG: hypothetical protein FWB76_03840 [Oscillospiraceae bacterium]|nr:hypothetical protein [Oscillospiraceae bacterium]
MSIRPDVMALARQYKAGTVLFRGSIRALSNALHPQEQPQVVLACTLTPSLTDTFDDDEERVGVIAVTNMRVAHASSEGVASFAFADIHSFRLDTEDDYVVRFGSQTHQWHALFMGAVGGSAEYAGVFLRLMQQLATGTAPANMATAAAASTAAQQVRVSCQSCGAHELLAPGQAVPCQYCNSALQAPALEPAPAPAATEPAPQEEQSTFGGGFLGGLLGGALGEIIEAVVEEFI